MQKKLIFAALLVLCISGAAIAQKNPFAKADSVASLLATATKISLVCKDCNPIDTTVVDVQSATVKKNLIARRDTGIRDVEFAFSATSSITYAVTPLADGSVALFVRGSAPELGSMNGFDVLFQGIKSGQQLPVRGLIGVGTAIFSKE
jgi:hypothetical protein